MTMNNSTKNYFKKLREYLKNKSKVELIDLYDFDMELNHDLFSLIADLVKSKNSMIRVQSIELLEQFNCRHHIPLIQSKLSDRNSMVRSAAAEALALLNDIESIPLIRKKIPLAKDEERQGYYFSLSLLGQKKYWSLFLKGLSNKNERIRCATLNRLYRFRKDKINRKQVVGVIEEQISIEKNEDLKKEFLCYLNYYKG